MAIQLPKQFIQQTLIKEYEDIIIAHGHAYLGFALIAIGIEFLGKCVDTSLTAWHPESSKHFDYALNNIPQLKSYSNKDLRDKLRNGMAHSLVPKVGLDLSERVHQTTHLGLDSQGYLVLNVEDFFEDFKKACRFVIETRFPDNDKMNKGFIKH